MGANGEESTEQEASTFSERVVARKTEATNAGDLLLRHARAQAAKVIVDYTVVVLINPIIRLHN